MAEYTKRKTWKSSSTSSTEEGLSPDDKKIRCNTSFTNSDASCESDKVICLLNMFIEQVESKLEELENYVKSVDAEVSNLQTKVECFESFQKKTEKTVKDIEDGMNFANKETESFKSSRTGKTLHGGLPAAREPTLFRNQRSSHGR